MKQEHLAIDSQKFWKEYSILIEEHEANIKAQRNQSPSADYPLTHSTFFKWTNGYLKNFPRDKTFIAVNSIIFKSNKPNDWVKQLDDGHLKTYISRKFLSTNSNYSLKSIDDLTIYESYIIASSITKRGIKRNELLNGISSIRYILNEDNLEDIDILDEAIIKAFYPYGNKIIQTFIEKEELIYKNGFLHYKNKNLRISSLKHSYNLKKIETLKPYLYRNQSSTEASVGISISLTSDKIEELRNDLRKILNKYSDNNESSNTESIPIRLGLSITKLIYDEFICNKKIEVTNENNKTN